MKQLFPIEIQQNSIQSLWVKRGKQTQIIYLVIILIVIAVFVSLPFVYVDVSAQSRGAVTTLNENNSIVSAIYAEVKAVDLYENTHAELYRDETKYYAMWQKQLPSSN